MRLRRTAELPPRDAATQHQHRITDAYLAVNPARRSHGAKDLFGAERILDELQQGRPILRDQIRRHRPVAFGNRIHRRLFACPSSIIARNRRCISSTDISSFTVDTFHEYPKGSSKFASRYP